MSNNKLSYLSRNFEDYRESLLAYVKQHYPQIANDFNDASVGSWLIDLMASIGDNLSFYIDKAYSETNVETAQRTSSLYNLARNNGLKIPGPKGAMAEVEFSCIVPAYTASTANSNSTLGMPVEDLMPVIRKGTKVSSRNQIFEVMEDIDFAAQFDNSGYPDRVMEGIYTNGNRATMYRVTKKGVVIAGESKIYRQVIEAKDIVPFMEIVLPDRNVMNVESIIFKDGSDFQSDPTMNEFMENQEEYIDRKGVKTYRFFEVNSLVEQYRWGDSNDGEPQGTTVTHSFGTDTNGNEIELPIISVHKGKWHNVKQKFITEFTDNGYLKIIFGSGERAGTNPEEGGFSSVAEYQMTKMLRNNFLGKLPKEGCTMYVLYRTGGGATSNVAAGTINNISYYNVNIGKTGNCDAKTISEIKNSITVTNPNPSVSGKDAPTADEMRAMIKYNSGAQNRCVTVKDYENRVAMIPPRYGCPFRISAVEENNKVMLYILGLDYQGKLSNAFPKQMIYNIMDYLSLYRTINDYVEITPGKIINLKFEIKIFADKNYVNTDVAADVINVVKNYMDINRHRIGEDIFVGDLEKEISNVDGVINLIDMKVYNVHGGDSYSLTRIAQPVIDGAGNTNEDLIDLEATDYILNSDADSMFEIRNPDKDIVVTIKER